MLNDDVAIFNLSAVIHETGIKPDTLRAWERRYGLPMPERTEGGHRLYSRQDIETIKWLMAQREQGLGISKAVQLWRELQAAAEESHTAVRPSLTSEAHDEQSDRIAKARDAWFDACMNFDERAAQTALAEAFAVFSVETVCLEVLLPAIVKLGGGWYSGDVTVQQEHFTVSLAVRQVESLIAAAPPPTKPGRILAVCPPREEHVFTLLLVTLILRRAGYDVVYLGANVPIEQIVETVNGGRFQLVVSAAMQLHTAAALADLAEELREHNTPLLYGGRVFSEQPDLQHRIAGYYLGKNLEAMATAVEPYLAAHTTAAPVPPMKKDIQDALEAYTELLPYIEAMVEDLLPKNAVYHQQLHQVNEYLHTGVTAGLRLGNLAYLTADIRWVLGLLSNRGFPDKVLYKYLEVYTQALEAQEDSRLQPIQEWFSQLLPTLVTMSANDGE